jgi:DnaJ family protein C protein 28
MPNIDEHIRRAMEEGKFDNLPGKGKPLRLEDDSLEDPGWRTAHRMLRNAGYSLPWIETRKELEADHEQARADLRRAWEWRQSTPADDPMGKEEWARAVNRFRERVEALNKKIAVYNLEAPLDSFQMKRINADRLLSELTGKPHSDTL